MKDESNEPSSSSAPKQTQVSLWGLISAGLFLVAVCTVLGFFSRFWWVFDTMSSLRLQYLEAALVAAIAFAIGRKKRQFAFALSVIIVNTALIVPMYIGGGPKPPETTCRLLLSNVKTDNTDYARVIGLVETEEPDLVILQEINKDWVASLSSLRNAYPHCIEYPESDNFGIGLYSKHPLNIMTVKHIGDINVASIHAAYEHNGELWHIIATHPLPPTGNDYWKWRNDQLAQLADYVQRLEGHVIVIGDLNMTEWSHYFSKFEQDSGLRNGSKGFGLNISWPTFFPPLGVSIDHCMVSPGLAVGDRRTGTSVGSDHFPVIFDVGPAPGDGENTRSMGSTPE